MYVQRYPNICLIFALFFTFQRKIRHYCWIVLITDIIVHVAHVFETSKWKNQMAQHNNHKREDNTDLVLVISVWTVILIAMAFMLTLSWEPDSANLYMSTGKYIQLSSKGIILKGMYIGLPRKWISCYWTHFVSIMLWYIQKDCNRTNELKIVGSH